MRELRTWCPALEVLLYYGSQEERRGIRADLIDGKMDNFHILLTTSVIVVFHILITFYVDLTLICVYACYYVSFCHCSVCRTLCHISSDHIIAAFIVRLLQKEERSCITKARDML